MVNKDKLRILSNRSIVHPESDTIIGVDMYEYDMREAGFNLCKRFKLLDSCTIDRLEKFCTKKGRHIEIGNFRRKDKNFSKILSDAFKYIRYEFMISNSLSIDNVVAVRNDSITTNVKCDVLVFDGVEFKMENKFSSYVKLNGIEFYIGEDTIDVKGISDNNLIYHQDFMLRFIYNVVKMLENKDKSVVDYIIEFINLYKKEQLDNGYYRPLSIKSLYPTRFKLYSNMLCVDEFLMDDDKRNSVVLGNGYNVTQFVIPLLRLSYYIMGE